MGLGINLVQEKEGNEMTSAKKRTMDRERTNQGRGCPKGLWKREDRKVGGGRAAYGGEKSLRWGHREEAK